MRRVYGASNSTMFFFLLLCLVLFGHVSSKLDEDVLMVADLTKPYNLKNPKGINIFHGWSQGSQDRMVHDALRQTKNGYFIEAGAYDCEKYSNTLYFEKYHKWKGLLIEGGPDFIPHCRRINRHNSSLAWAALDIGDGNKYLSFKSAGPLGGLVETNLNNERIEEWIKGKTDSKGIGVGTISQVPVRTIQELLLADGRKCAKTCFQYKSNNELEIKDDQNVSIDETLIVDFFSLDTEGSEAFILDAIDFNKITIGIILVEWNGNKKQIESIRNVTSFKFKDILEVELSDEYFGKLDRMFYSQKYFDMKGWGKPNDGISMYKNERNQIRIHYKYFERLSRRKKNQHKMPRTTTPKLSN